MPKYIVTVEITQKRDKELTIWADDEDAAESKAEDIVLAWDSVTDVDVTSVEVA